MPRYVVLRHDPPLQPDRAVHWDFLLEETHHLLTWALAEEPQYGVAIPASRLPDHRKAYLTYEGPISGDRGHVTCYDRGDYEWLQRGDNEILVRLAGEKLSGNARLVRRESQPDQWTLYITDRFSPCPPCPLGD